MWQLSVIICKHSAITSRQAQCAQRYNYAVVAIIPFSIMKHGCFYSNNFNDIFDRLDKFLLYNSDTYGHTLLFHKYKKLTWYNKNNMFCLITTDSLLAIIIISLAHETAHRTNWYLFSFSLKFFTNFIGKFFFASRSRRRFSWAELSCSHFNFFKIFEVRDVITVTSNELVVIRQNILFLLYHVTFFICEIIKYDYECHYFTVKTQLIGQKCH